MSPFDPPQKNYPLVSGADIPNSKDDEMNSRYVRITKFGHGNIGRLMRN